MKRWAGVILTAMAMVVAVLSRTASAGPPAATPEEKAVAITQPSTVYLEQYWRTWIKIPGGTGYINHGQPFNLSFRCTGFIITPDGYIATAGHCVNAEDFKYSAAIAAVGYLQQNNLIATYFFAGRTHTLDPGTLVNEAFSNWSYEGSTAGSQPDLGVYVQRGTATSGQKTGESIAARVISSTPVSKGDVALLKVEKTGLPSLQISTAADLPIGTTVLAVGYPGDKDVIADASLDPTFKDGKISAKNTRQGGLLPVYEDSAALSGGMSGGPTVDLNGNVVGINSQSLAKGTGAAQDANFNFITPVSLLNEMLNANGVHPALSQTDKDWRAGLSMYFAGDGRGAVTKFESIAAAEPTRPLVQDYLLKAQTVAKTQSSFPTALLLIVLGVLLVGGGGAFIFMRNRGKATAPSTIAAPATTTTEHEMSIGETAPHVESTSVVTPPAETPVVAQTPEVLWGVPDTVVLPPDEPAQPITVAETPLQAMPHTPGAEQAQPSAATVVTAVPQNGAQPVSRYCSKCGAVAAKGANFCANCGTTIS